jgi:hypothetical protein
MRGIAECHSAPHSPCYLSPRSLSAGSRVRKGFTLLALALALTPGLESCLLHVETMLPVLLPPRARVRGRGRALHIRLQPHSTAL